MSMQIEGRQFSAKELGFLASTMRGFDPKKSFGLSRAALKGSAAALVEASSALAAATEGIQAMPIRTPSRTPKTPTTPSAPSTPKKPRTPAQEPATPSKPGWSPNKPKPGRPLE